MKRDVDVIFFACNKLTEWRTKDCFVSLFTGIIKNTNNQVTCKITYGL